MTLLHIQELDIWDLWSESQMKYPGERIKKIIDYCKSNNCSICDAISFLIKEMNHDDILYIETEFEKCYIQKTGRKWFTNLIPEQRSEFQGIGSYDHLYNEAEAVGHEVDLEGRYLGGLDYFIHSVIPAAESDGYKALCNMMVNNKSNVSESLPDHFCIDSNDAELYFSKLIDSKLLAQETLLSHFLYAFSGKEIPDNEKPFKTLTWRNKRGDKALLAYFIAELFWSDKSGYYPDKKASTLFGVTGLKQAVYQYGGTESTGGKPTGHRLIDNILNK